MIRLEFSIELNYEINQPGSDFIFSIHAAKTGYQTVVTEYLNVNQNIDLTMYTDPVNHTRLLRLYPSPFLSPGFLSSKKKYKCFPL